MKKRSFARAVRPILAALALVAVAAFFLLSLAQLDAGRGEESRAQLEEVLRRAAVSCYAAEGYYPPTLEALTAYAGLQVDFDRYAVFYDVFAENLMPEITVVELS